MLLSLPNWPTLLHKFLAERMNTPFVWGKHDCCLFACDAVLAMTGEDLAGDFRGKYDSALSAVRTMQAFTAENAESAEKITRLLDLSRQAVDYPITKSGDLVGLVADRIAQNHGIKEIPPLMAQRGDVALVLAARGESLGIVSLRGDSVLSPGEKGLIALPLKMALKVWRIPKATSVIPNSNG